MQITDANLIEAAKLDKKGKEKRKKKTNTSTTPAHTDIPVLSCTGYTHTEYTGSSAV